MSDAARVLIAFEDDSGFHDVDTTVNFFTDTPEQRANVATLVEYGIIVVTGGSGAAPPSVPTPPPPAEGDEPLLPPPSIPVEVGPPLDAMAAGRMAGEDAE